MLILASGDHHFAQGARWDECLRIHTWIADLVEERRPEIFLSAGDVYERASTPVERDAVAEWLTRIADVCPVVIAKGNHDRTLDLELLGRLRTRHPVIVEERAGVHVVGGVAVAVFAWPSRAMIAQALGERAAPETVADAGRDALRHVLRGLGDELVKHDGPRILLGHAQVVGATVGQHGQPLAPGAEVTLGLEDLALACADAVVLGHVHKAQEWDYGGMPIAYTGSPFRNSFGEAEPKSILALHIEGRRVELERIPTPAAPMVLLEAEYSEGGLRLEPPALVSDAEIRLRYTTPAELRESARGLAHQVRDELLERGAASVKVEEVVATATHARAPEVAAARGPIAQLDAYWNARSDAPPEEQRASLRSKVSALIEARSAA